VSTGVLTQRESAGSRDVVSLIKTDPSRCLALQHSRSTCRRCEEICPVGAIHITGSGVEVSQERCIGCGLCLTSCPTGAFNLSGLDWTILLDEAVRRAIGGGLILSCARVTSAEGFTLPCVGMLGGDLLTALVAKGINRLTFRIGECANCPLYADGLVDKILTEIGERWLGGFDVMRETLEIPMDPSTFDDILLNLVELTEPRLDRRGFLSEALQRARSRLADPNTTCESGSWGTRQHDVRVPATRLILLEALGENHDRVAFPRRAVGDGCDDCQDADSLCSRHCPSGALQRVDEGPRVRLVFDPGLCLDCGQCEIACPHDAVTREPDQPGRQSVTLRTTMKYSCERCGLSSTGVVAGLCPECRRSSQLRELLAGWAFPDNHS